jgi:predicted nucleotidyltransferase
MDNEDSERALHQFLDSLSKCKGESAILDFCRKHSLHGTPKIFSGAEDAYYDFRKRVAAKFDINFHEVFIIGSAKLGFNPHRRRLFSYESDIDVAIVSTLLYERIMEFIQDFQMQLREDRKAVTDRDLRMYHKFLEYGAIGWMRPDLLPTSFQVTELKDDWFNFFRSLSYGKSEVGNYKVSAGVFKTYRHLERYAVSGLLSLKLAEQMGNSHANTDQA